MSHYYSQGTVLLTPPSSACSESESEDADTEDSEATAEEVRVTDSGVESEQTSVTASEVRLDSDTSSVNSRDGGDRERVHTMRSRASNEGSRRFHNHGEGLMTL